jgi:hypothetical protein
MYNYKPPSTTCCGWGFIVDDCENKDKMKMEGREKNKSKHLGIIKNGTRYTAKDARKKKTSSHFSHSFNLAS